MMHEGDIFRWSYKPGKEPLNTHDPYWCKSQIAQVVRFSALGLILKDTYWCVGVDNSAWWELGCARRHVDLEFVANLRDLVEADKFVHEAYAPEDIVDLSHPNGGKIYLRSGAKPCAGVQRRVWQKELSAAQRRVDYYQRLLDTEEASVN